ncbi:hypothetical protein [Pseudomonas graminis]|uniref:hypothetical protein n=1 Tax=Pseudomonas graminis TaxID=158627 RepID=UPI003C163077
MSAIDDADSVFASCNMASLGNSRSATSKFQAGITVLVAKCSSPCYRRICQPYFSRRAHRSSETYTCNRTVFESYYRWGYEISSREIKTHPDAINVAYSRILDKHFPGVNAYSITYEAAIDIQCGVLNLNPVYGSAVYQVQFAAVYHSEIPGIEDSIKGSCYSVDLIHRDFLSINKLRFQSNRHLVCIR